MPIFSAQTHRIIKTRLYTKLFNEKNDSTHNIESDSGLDDFNRKYQHHEFDYKLETNGISDIIGSLPSGKSIGLHGVSNEMIKCAASSTLVNILKNLFEKIINSQVFPCLFNISIIKPLIKDVKKPVDNTDVIVLISKKFSFVSFTRQEDGSIEGEILPEGKSDACEIDETRGGVIKLNLIVQ
ncbi:hypothetical protein BpHYR1_028217 [Brachionus plicatilis]|uniref:Uncharacterized protein n=1 Tax=Brachionus plicatilis TaxID=10195 RepID=A0A3M7PPX3_BRAPC|nr:hypothetical protein BpHYR1_028217 [Brachionus plicatilis]